MRALRLPLLLIALLLAAPAIAQQVPVPALEARVTDLTATLSAPQRQSLERKLAAFEQSKGSQIAVLLVPTTGEETIEQYGIRVAEQWQLGRRGVDDGILLLVALEDRTVRVEVGYGLEGAVPDAVANRVVEDVIIPHFRQGNFFAGISAGVDTLQRLLEGEPLPAPSERQGPVGDAPILFIFIAFFMLSGILRAALGRLPGALLTGGVIALLFYFLVGPLLVAVFAGLFAFVFALAGGVPLAGGGYYGGRGRGGFGRGGFGGGGFGGGGGGFGGGGASGRW